MTPTHKPNITELQRIERETHWERTVRESERRVYTELDRLFCVMRPTIEAINQGMKCTANRLGATS